MSSPENERPRPATTSEAQAQIAPDTFNDLDERATGVLRTFYIAPDEVLLSVNDDIMFQATIHDDSPNNQRIIRLHIVTKDKEGNRHPYFARHPAHELAARAIKHFDRYGAVRSIEFVWHRDNPAMPVGQSDNYKTYIEVRDNALAAGDSTYEARRKAVMATWTFQRIGAPNGFETIELEELNEDGERADKPDVVTGILKRNPK